MPDLPSTIAKQSPTKKATTTPELIKKSFLTSPSLAYCFTFFFLVCTLLFFFNNPSNHRSSIWFSNILNTRSHFPSVFSHFFPNASSPRDSFARSGENDLFSGKTNTSFTRSANSSTPKTSVPKISRHGNGFSGKANSSSISGNNSSVSAYKIRSPEFQVRASNGPTKEALDNSTAKISQEKYEFYRKRNSSSNPMDEASRYNEGPMEKSHLNETQSAHSAKIGTIKGSVDKSNSTKRNVDGAKMASSSPEAAENPTRTAANGDAIAEQRKENWWEAMSHCDIFDGKWVKDDSYPLYAAGSCPHIDEPFDCYHNGRPENGYEKFRWQPKGCKIPRLNGRDMLELLRGKRLVYVGDSLNRNMWESMVCTLRNAIKDKSKVFEASGRHEFRTEGSYSFIFKDYNCSVEFFRSTFLVQEWEMPDANGLKKETLRLDLVEGSSDRYKSADILVFNTGHWWTHEKTSQGKDYYQEGSHVYNELNVIEAFRKAMTTWGGWIDANINPAKTLVLFRGFSASHFSGGQWNSGGQCDSETEPIRNETYLSQYPPIMSMLERVMKGMKTPVLYLNVTKMTDFRKDAHPSIYRSQHLTEEERQSPLRFQDCSHWCLPGVPETWNELLYAQIFTVYKQKAQQKKQQQRQRRQ